MHLSDFWQRFLGSALGRGLAGAMVALAALGLAPPPPVIHDRPAATEILRDPPGPAPDSERGADDGD
jgi:hypothetical protein